jgi:lysine 2,3-aminomutase
MPSRTPFTPSRCVRDRRHELFPEATDEEWTDWRWQLRHAIRDLSALEKRLVLTDDERGGLIRTSTIFRLGISPYYLALIDRESPFCPVRMQAIPAYGEGDVRPGELDDPLGEDLHRPVPAIVHKYPDRVLFLAIDSCSVYCRHCTRRRITKGGEAQLSRTELSRGLDYIRSNPRIRDVLISGGDPLLLSDERLEELLGAVRAVPHVEIIRIGTRVPVTLPMRVTPALAQVLRRHAPVYVVTHFNHPKEVTAEAREACERLVDAGVPVENQTVLLRRVNSSARIIGELNHACLRMRVRPYYLHQMDVAQGCEHFRTPLSKGVEILEELRGWTSGLAVPHLAVDLPGGGGKVTLQPKYLQEQTTEAAVFRNYLGERYVYPEPRETDCECPYDEVWRSR